VKKEKKFNIIKYIRNLFEFKDGDSKLEDEKVKASNEVKDEDKSISKKMKKKSNKKRNR
jgi:hypothetical protein